jgi:hypothetical protein
MFTSTVLAAVILGHVASSRPKWTMPTTPLLVISCNGKPPALLNTPMECSGDLNSHVGPVNGCSGQDFG